MLSPIATVVYKHFEEITDPRLNRGLNHDLGEMMFVALTAALAGADSWADVERFGTSHQDWFAKHLPLENGIRTVNLIKPTEKPSVQSLSSHPKSGISAEPIDRFGDRSSLQDDLPPPIARFLAHCAKNLRRACESRSRSTETENSRRLKLRVDNIAAGRRVVRGIRFSRLQIRLPDRVRSVDYRDLDGFFLRENGRHTGRAFSAANLHRKRSFDPTLRISDFA